MSTRHRSRCLPPVAVSILAAWVTGCVAKGGSSPAALSFADGEPWTVENHHRDESPLRTAEALAEVHIPSRPGGTKVGIDVELPTGLYGYEPFQFPELYEEPSELTRNLWWLGAELSYGLYEAARLEKWLETNP